MACASARIKHNQEMKMTRQIYPLIIKVIPEKGPK